MDRNNYRTRLEILTFFLRELKKREKVGLTKTRLTQQSNLSPQGFKCYFSKIMESKLIEPRTMDIKRLGRKGRIARTSRRFFITELGKSFLKKSDLLLSKIEKLNEEFKINLREVSYIN